jgi:hypothetical protein
VQPEAVAVLPFALVGEKDRGRPVEKAVCAALAAKLPLATRAPSGYAAPYECEGATVREARWLMHGRVVNESRGGGGGGHDYSIEVELVDATGLRTPLRLDDRCDICGFAEMLARVAQTAATLVDAIAARPPAPQVTVAPPPAPPPAGTVEKQPATTAVAVEKREPPARRRAPDALVLGKWLTLAAFVGLATTGAVMLAYDGRGTCDLPSGSTLRCPRFYDTAVEGGLILAAGLAAGAASATLFALDHRRSHRVIPALAPTPKGAMLSLLATF